MPHTSGPSAPHILQCRDWEPPSGWKSRARGVCSRMGPSHTPLLHSPLLEQSPLFSPPLPTGMLKLGRSLYTPSGSIHVKRGRCQTLTWSSSETGYPIAVHPDHTSAAAVGGLNEGFSVGPAPHRAGLFTRNEHLLLQQDFVVKADQWVKADQTPCLCE